MEGLIKGRNNQVRGAHLKVVKTNGVVQRQVSRPYKIKGKEGNVNSDILSKENLNKDSEKKESRDNWGIKTKIHNRCKVILPRWECLNIKSPLCSFITCFFVIMIGQTKVSYCV